MTDPEPIAAFHPAIAAWFARRFPEGPTEAQSAGWSSIANGDDTLIAAPTGSGKTLAAFLVAIDHCLRRAIAHGTKQGTSVVYVSPLRALTVDIAENLEQPLAEISALAAELGAVVPSIGVAVRNGDTPPAARSAMLRNRPEIIVTTPESLYLLVTARRGRELLANVDTVIVDEIHAVARDKRGSHLALTLERLDRLVAGHNEGRRPTRIGCSATQRPIEAIARLLVGAGADRSTPTGAPRCRIVDVGHRRPLDIAITRTSDELGAVMTNEQLGEIVSSLAEEIRGHRTTLVFVNTRKMSERVAYLLAGELGEDVVCAHHGSLSTERRLRVEARLRGGDLRAVIATASLELGIDVGPVDLVCQLGSPRAIATFLQRVGRAEHRRDGLPKGRLYPTTRDELVECVALFGALHAGRLDATQPPVAPLDILAQQVVAECAAAGEEGIALDELAELVRHAAPYEALQDGSLEAVITLVCEGVTTGRGTRGADVQRDLVNGRLRARRGARLVAATSGGAIPELADYRVLLEPEETVIGSVHEDFAVEAMAGDVFLLGSASWRIRRVEQGTVRVVDAKGAAPTIPFWLGEAPARTDELSQALCELRVMVEDRLTACGIGAAIEAVRGWAQVSAAVAAELVAYLGAALTELGALPNATRLVLERFFDDTGGMQLVLHSPYGGRINRGLGLALRKRFCATFDFELQAAASDDAIVLSLGPQHAFALEEVGRYLAPATVREVLVQAVLPTPIFTSRWRWNLSRSLVSPRWRGSRHLPAAIQRMEADDLMAAIFPALAACQENATGGPIEVPDHPIVNQTLEDCFHEAIDLAGLVALVTALREGSVALHGVDTSEPSVLSHEILNGRPYTFLDDAPLEERRTRAVALRRGLPLQAHDLTHLDDDVVAQVRAEAAPAPRDADELHDVLHVLVVSGPAEEWRAMFEQLVAQGRAMHVEQRHGASLWARWCTTERRREVAALWPGCTFRPEHPLPARLAASDPPARHQAIELAVRGHLEHLGLVTVADLAERLAIECQAVEAALGAIEASGAALRVLHGQWCARGLAARMHARQRDRQRSSFAAVSAQQLVRFLLEWQHVAPGTRLRELGGLAATVGQLQGFELPVGAWEESVLPARVAGYHPQLLDELCAHGELAWGRLTALHSDPDGVPRRSGASPSRATPVALVCRDDLDWLLAAARGDTAPADCGPGAVGEILEALEARGALFFADLCAATGRLPLEVADALWDGVARGRLTSDGFQAVRALLAGRYRRPASDARHTRMARGHAPRPVAGRHRVPPALAGGRWSLLAGSAASQFEPDELADALAAQLLERWGVVFRDLVQRESLALSWREILWALRRLEARGIARGGRFVAGFVGEQFALPEALELLRRTAKRPLDQTTIWLSAADPLNLSGTVLPGPRVPAVRGRQIVFVDGVLAGPDSPSAARLITSAAS